MAKAFVYQCVRMASSLSAGVSSPQELLLLHLIDDPGVKQLLHEDGLLPQDCHGGAVALDGLEALRGLHLALQDEAPDLQLSQTCQAPSLMLWATEQYESMLGMDIPVFISTSRSRVKRHTCTAMGRRQSPSLLLWLNHRANDSRMLVTDGSLSNQQGQQALRYCVGEIYCSYHLRQVEGGRGWGCRKTLYLSQLSINLLQQHCGCRVGPQHLHL